MGEVSYAGGKVRAGRQRPERAARTHLSLVRSSGLPEALDIGIRGSREEEQLVEIALAQEFRLALRQSGVLRQFPRRKLAQRYGLDAGFFRHILEHFCCSRLRRCRWDARKAP